MQLLGRKIGLDQPFFLIAGPCVIESEELQLRTAETAEAHHRQARHHAHLQVELRQGQPLVRQEFPRARTWTRVCGSLRRYATRSACPILTDVHDIPQIEPVAEVVDVLQTPAFLARQTDFIHAVAASGKPVNIKKAQFMAPHDMKNVVDKARNAAQSAGVNEDTIMVCERGVSFGYNNLVSDMRSLSIMRETGCPGGVRRDPLRAAAGRAGHELRRSARIRAGSRKRRRGDGHLRIVHGNASRSGECDVGRAERLAAGSDGKPADDAGGARPAGEIAQFRGSVALGRNGLSGAHAPVFLP